MDINYVCRRAEEEPVVHRLFQYPANPLEMFSEQVIVEKYRFTLAPINFL